MNGENRTEAQGFEKERKKNAKNDCAHTYLKKSIEESEGEKTRKKQQKKKKKNEKTTQQSEE